MTPRALRLAACAATLATTAGAQNLFVVNDESLSVMLLSIVDGSILDPMAVDLTLSPTLTDPIEAVRVGVEIWVSDNGDDSIHRFTADGSAFLGVFTGGPTDNVRGIEFFNGSVYVTNTGGAGGAPGYALIEYDPQGTELDSWYVYDPYDVVAFEGDLLVCIRSEDRIRRFTTDGVELAPFLESDGVTGINSPSQMIVHPSGNVFVGGFHPTAGVYEYDPSGNQVSFYDTGILTRAGYPLQNGQILYTSFYGVEVFDPATGTTTTIVDESAQHISPVGTGGIGVKYCATSINSTGSPADISGTGTSSIALNNLILIAQPVPNQPGIFFYGPDQIFQPFGNGFRCVGGTVGRLAVANAAGGTIAHALDVTQPPNAATTITPGSTWNFQCWYRDPAGGGAAFNLSDGLEVSFVP